VREPSTLDGGRTFEYRNYAGVEDIAPIDCLPTAELMFELPRVDQKNVYQELETTVTQALILTHGTVAGNIAAFNAPLAQLSTSRNPS
jgi:hypothetical protein